MIIDAIKDKKAEAESRKEKLELYLKEKNQELNEIRKLIDSDPDDIDKLKAQEHSIIMLIDANEELLADKDYNRGYSFDDIEQELKSLFKQYDKTHSEIENKIEHYLLKLEELIQERDDLEDDAIENKRLILGYCSQDEENELMSRESYTIKKSIRLSDMVIRLLNNV